MSFLSANCIPNILPFAVPRNIGGIIQNLKQSSLYEQLEVIPYATVEENVHQKVEEVRVDMADMKVESKPVELLTSVGSCVAICVYDPRFKCGGLAHIMLPYSANAKHEPLPSKFADTAVPALAKAIRRISGNNTRFLAKIAGGANMFGDISLDTLHIGARNVKAVKDALMENKIRLAGEDVGGLCGRKISFSLLSGIVTVRRHNGVVTKI